MTFYIPRVHFNPNTQVIAIPNKNIQSYFMRNENSFFVSESNKFPAYKNEDDIILTVVLLTTDMIFYTHLEDCVIITNDSSKYDDAIQTHDILLQNTELGEGTEKQDDELKINDPKHTNIITTTKILVSPTIIQDKEFFDTLFSLSNFNTENFHSINSAMLYLYKKIQQIYPNSFKNSFINFVFQDLFNRTEIMQLIDMYLKWFGAKGIMVTPYSVACCFGMNVPSASIFHMQSYHSQINFVDEFCYIYGHRISNETKPNPNFVSYDSEDFVEEFNKQKFRIGKRIFTCNFCQINYDEHNDIITHLKNMHTTQLCEENEENMDQYFIEKSEDIEFENSDEEANFNLLLKNLGHEKEKKVSPIRIIIGKCKKEFSFENDKSFSVIKDVS